MSRDKTLPIDRILLPFRHFSKQEKSGGIVLGITVIIALFLANSPWSDFYFHFFEHKLGFIFDGRTYLEYNIHHWINDGLMSIFFFVVGLELKQELVSGELANPRKAMLPIIAALGGMLVPAIIYKSLNPAGEMGNGWGIPMATDIAFALGVLYLLGNKVPLSLKVFLAALAIVDDLGAVLVIAFFYTSEISFTSLITGFGFAGLMFLANKMGVRNVIFYAFLGIVGLWTAFLLSGVHATIAAVIAAFTIPSDMEVKESTYYKKITDALQRFRSVDPEDQKPNLTGKQLHILQDIKSDTAAAISPLQRLLHAMHPFVTFFVLPIFALANAGISLDIDLDNLFSSHVALGVALGLIVGKVVGVVGFTWLSVKLKLTSFPSGMTIRHLLGLGLLAAIGFTMSMFITSLAFTSEEYIVQAKIGIFTASIIGGLTGYWILKNAKQDANL